MIRSALSFIESLEDAFQSIKDMNDQRNHLNQTSPQVPRWFFTKARKGVEKGESEYEVDKKT